ncbi:MAG: polymer-forming cytoskeletal protein [Myxococcales bacterium]|nr:polymer-forming cytoskeletal protein [Myxococcales bacterium]
MALSSFGRGRDLEGNPRSEARPPPAVSSSPGGLTAFIDQGSDFEGKLSFKDTVRIDGRFRGEISSENTLIVGESGEIQATIRSNTVVMSGTLEGDIVASHKVVLHKTARVTGNIETPSLMMEEGAILNGQVKMEVPGTRSAAGGSLKAIAGGGSPTGSGGPAKPSEAQPKAPSS